MNILELLYQRQWQLQGRIIEIQNYAKIDAESFNKKDWGLKDIPNLKEKIGECQAAIKAIEKYRSENKKLIRKQKDKRSVATGDDSSNSADTIEKENYEYERGNE